MTKTKTAPIEAPPSDLAAMLNVRKTLQPFPIHEQVAILKYLLSRLDPGPFTGTAMNAVVVDGRVSQWSAEP